MLIFALCCVFPAMSYAQRATGRSSLQRSLADSFASDRPDDTALLLASYTGDVNQVTQLLRTGANVNARQLDPSFYPDWTPICFAVIKSNLPMVRLLLEHNAQVATCGLPVGTVRNPEIVRLLLLHGADPNEGKDQNARNTPLLVAAMNWWADPSPYTTIITLLLDYGADPNARNSFGQTALLLIHDNPPFPPVGLNNFGKALRPLNSSDYYPQVIRALVEHGARVNDTQAYDTDDACCTSPDYRNGLPYCRALTPQGCNLHAQLVPCEPGRLEHFDTRLTPLMQAVQTNSAPTLVIALLDSGADSSLKDSQNRTALDMANTEEMKLLLRNDPSRHTRASSTSGGNPTNLSSRPMATKAERAPSSVRQQPAQHSSAGFDADVHRNEFICYNGPNRRTTIKQNADSSFGSERLLDVVISDPSGMQDGASEADVATEITNALVIWRRMCAECATANAAVLRINGRVFLDPNLKSILDTINYSIDYEIQRLPVAYAMPCSPSKPIKLAVSCPTCPISADNSHHESLEKNEPAKNASPGWPIDLAESLLSTRLGLRVPLFPYIEVNSSDPNVAKLCAAPYAKVPLVLKGARAAFECTADAQLPRTSRAYLKIKLDNGYTTCGPDDNIVGCESNEFLLELNAARYKFVKHGTAQSLFGHGNILVDLQIVLMHELGHWVGIQKHFRTPRNIMSAYLSDAHCIDEAVVKALATATQSPINQTSSQALYYRRPDGRSSARSRLNGDRQ